AAGGVGHYAVQIAKYFGAHVIGTASASNREFVLGLGADEFIDYTNEKFEDKVKDVDVIVDSVNEEHLWRSLSVVKKGGRLISIKAHFVGEMADKAKEKEVFARRISVTSNGEDMGQIAKLLKEGRIRSHVSGKYSFKDLPKAHQQIETRKTQGKIVVSL
ncbi:MAG TPA: NADP-dependent oxidoreductase, partial [Cytophagales bacterium]|nr:NADP-dependent oxidoreductase [Cytophagales bacterium]